MVWYGTIVYNPSCDTIGAHTLSSFGTAPGGWRVIFNEERFGWYGAIH